MITIIFEEKEYKAEKYFSIGRSSLCNIKVKDIKLSRVHCEIVKDEEDYILIDLHSQNGTQLNAHFITEAILNNNDEISIGKYVFKFISDKKSKKSDLPPLKQIPTKKVGLNDV